MRDVLITRSNWESFASCPGPCLPLRCEPRTLPRRGVSHQIYADLSRHIGPLAQELAARAQGALAKQHGREEARRAGQGLRRANLRVRTAYVPPAPPLS